MSMAYSLLRQVVQSIDDGDLPGAVRLILAARDELDRRGDVDPLAAELVVRLARAVADVVTLRAVVIHQTALRGQQIQMWGDSR